MMNLTLIYKFQKDFFVSGTFTCPIVKKEDELSLQTKRAKYEDKIFIKSQKDALDIIKTFRLKEYFPIRTYFKYEGYEIEEEAITEIKEILGGAEAIWVNFQESIV